MFRKLRYRWANYKLKRIYTRHIKNLQSPPQEQQQELFTREEALQIYNQGVDKGYGLGYTVGRNDGVDIAKKAAQKHLKELIRS